MSRRSSVHLSSGAEKKVHMGAETHRIDYAGHDDFLRDEKERASIAFKAVSICSRVLK